MFSVVFLLFVCSYVRLSRSLFLEPCSLPLFDMPRSSRPRLCRDPRCLFLLIPKNHTKTHQKPTTNPQQPTNKPTTKQKQGEAQSARLIGQALSSNPAFLSLRRIEAAREIAGTVSASANRVYLNADSLLLNLDAVSVANAGGAGGKK